MSDADFETKFQEILDEAKVWEESPEGQRTRARAKVALDAGDMKTAVGIMLGAVGYEEKLH